MPEPWSEEWFESMELSPLTARQERWQSWLARGAWDRPLLRTTPLGRRVLAGLDWDEELRGRIRTVRERARKRNRPSPPLLTVCPV